MTLTDTGIYVIEIQHSPARALSQTVASSNRKADPLAKLKEIKPRLQRASAGKLRYLPTEGGFAKAHYQTAEHREWARAVKQRDGYTCQACGAQRGDVDKDGNRIRLVADHITEARDGGALLDTSNGRCVCLACHNRKTEQAKRERAGLLPRKPIGADGWPVE